MTPAPRGISRRGFLHAGLAAPALALAAGTAAGARPRDVPWETPPVCVFSKHLQFLDYDQLAAAAKDCGFDGIDLTVRPKGHVLPDRLDQDLPRACKAIREAGLHVAMITTQLNSPASPHAEAILARAAELDIPFARVGGHRYAEGRGIEEQLEEILQDLRGLAALAEQYGVSLGYHNHSGYGNFGGPLWDLHRACKAVGSSALGSNFDLGHAKAEGAYGAWEINTRLLAPYVRMISVKDFVWEADKPKWVPLGAGVVPTPEMLRLLREEKFNGPVSVHVEYDVDSDAAMLEQMRMTVPVLRSALAEAGYSPRAG